MTDFKYVEEWNNACQINNPDEPTIIHEDQGCLMFKLMYEELLEFKTAIKDYDKAKKEKLVEILDAFCDIRYLLDGTIRQYGLHEVFDEALAEVHRSNISKTVNGVLEIREDGKILKGQHYFKPDLNKVFKQAA